MIKALLFDCVQLIYGVDSALAMLNTITGIDALDAPASNSQSKWVAAASQKRYQEITESSQKSITSLHLNCLTFDEGGAFLNGASSFKLRTLLDESKFTCAVRLCLGLPVAAAYRCACGEGFDSLGSHALICRRPSQANQAPHYQQVRARRLCVYGRARDYGASETVKERRKTTWWNNRSSLFQRPGAVLGRHMLESLCAHVRRGRV